MDAGVGVVDEEAVCEGVCDEEAVCDGVCDAVGVCEGVAVGVGVMLGVAEVVGELLGVDVAEPPAEKVDVGVAESVGEDDGDGGTHAVSTTPPAAPAVVEPPAKVTAP